MHLLDLFMYAILYAVIWNIIDFASNEEFTKEMGVLVGCFFMLVYTIIYVILFVWIDYNWIDIFNIVYSFSINLKL